MTEAGAARMTDESRASCLSDVARWVREKPEASALLGPGEAPISFAILSARIAAVGKMLQEAGVARGDIVAVAMPDGPDFLSGLLGVGEVAAAAPMDSRLKAAEFRSRLALLEARALLVPSCADGHAATVAKELGVPLIEVDFHPDGELGPAPPPLPRANCTLRATEECALVLQTSATTGDPKLVPLTQRNLYAMCAGVAQCLELRPQDRYLSIMPLHHILGFSSALAQLMVGGSVACTGFDSQRFRGWIQDLAPTWYAAGPALHRAILEIAREDPGPFHRSPLRFVRCGSGAGSTALFAQIEEVLRVHVVNGYGLTEVGPATNTPPHLPRKPGSVGRTIGLEIGIMDGQGNLLAPDAEGEVVLRGAAVMEGYLGAEEANREVFRDGWFRTGDLGRLNSEGDLFITGRIKEMINRGGETISPLEIDHAVAEHPSVLRTACFAVPHPTLQEDIVAAVSLRPGYRANASEIRSFLIPRLSRSKIPGRIWFTETIPVSASGKPLRDVLRDSFLSASRGEHNPASDATGDAAAAELRERVGTVWMRILESEYPGAEDNFFGMGGDSLSAARLFSALEQEMQLPKHALDLGRFLDSPNFQRLVEVVEEASRPGGSISSETFFGDISIVCLQPAGELPPVFAAPGDKSDPWPLRHLARALGRERPLYGLRHQLGSADRFSEMAGQFVTLITRLHPTGPLILAGHCFGGILAYEIAQRLAAQSRPVSLVLLDVETPGYPRASARRYFAYVPQAMRRLVRGEAGALAAELIGHFRFLRARQERRESAAAKASSPVASPPPATAGPVASSLSPGGVVLRTYVPRPFSGPMVNVLANSTISSERVLQDARKGWRDLARGPYQERSLPGSHTTFYTAENAAAMADFVRLVP